MRSFDSHAETTTSRGPAEPVSDPDAALVSAAGNGDMSAAAELLTRHADKIYALGYRMLGNAEAAEDLTQDVFFKIWKNATDWQPGRARFSTWLYRVAINLCYDRLRKRRESSVEDLPEVMRDQASDETAEYVLERQLTRDRVQEAIASLPERQAAAIMLCHFHGYTNKEAAQIMDTSDEAVESLLARGRRKLKELLKDERIGGK